MQHFWIIETLIDLHNYAKLNGLSKTANDLKHILETIEVDIKSNSGNMHPQSNSCMDNYIGSEREH
jgi:hypothetical protein